MPIRKVGPKKKDTTPDPLEDVFVCPHCGRTLKRSSFYASSDPAVVIGIAYPCKECARNIAKRYNVHTKMFAECTEESLKTALEYLDKPYLQKLWDTSYKEVHDPTSQRSKSSVWDAYIKNVQMNQYRSMRWKDSDMFMGQNNALERAQETAELLEDDALFKKNRKAVINFIGYDPYKNYPIPADLPILYAKLLSFLDEETKNDGMKLNAVIQICKEFNQVEKINMSIDEMSSDPKTLISNATLIKNLHDASSKALSSANTLAKDNGISVNYNNNRSKGASTLSGKMKKMYEIGLWDAKINTYDIGTCEGMQQVAYLNEEARHKQIGYDDSIAQEIKDIKVELVERLTRERDEAVETARKLLLENKDLKDFLLEKGMVDENYEVIDNE